MLTIIHMGSDHGQILDVEMLQLCGFGVMNIVFIPIWLNADFMEKMDTNSR